MINYKQSIAKFAALTYEQKKKKVIAMLDVLKEEWNVFQDLWDLIHVVKTPSESILDMIYKVIVWAMYSLKEEELEKSVSKLEKIKDKMAGIKHKEKMEKEDADAILNKII